MDGTKSGYKDYYYILGVRPNATRQEIQQAFEDLYNRFGPHVSVMGQDPDAMLKAYRDICEAYEILNDPAKRQQFDRINTDQLADKAHLRQLWGKITNATDSVQSAAAQTSSASTGASTATSSANTTRSEVTLTLREAIKGTTRKFRIEEHVPCRNCVTFKPVQRMKCDQCRGTGHAANVRQEEVLLPQKCYDKQEICIPQSGKFDLRTNEYQDLIVIVNVQSTSFFTVNVKDISCTVPVTILEAVLGAEIQVPTPTGKVVMKVQPLSQNGRVYRLKGMGLGGGDFLVTLQVVLPAQINVDELELYRKLNAMNTMRNPRDEVFQKIAAENEQQSQS